LASLNSLVAGGPLFGHAKLNDCEREKIHLPGSIQPHGALLALNSDFTIVKASENAVDFLGLSPQTKLLSVNLSEIEPELVTEIAARAAADDLDIPFATTSYSNASFDCIVHKSKSTEFVLEFEHAQPPIESISELVQEGMESITEAQSIRSLCDISAKLFKHLFGYDRVMIYRFAPDGNGEVYAEQCEAHMEPYLGNHYPASDIPQIARELYKRNRVRMLPDVHYTPVTIRPRSKVGEADQFDMTLCHLRSMSPIHIQYLQNMKVQASLVSSLLSGDALWGLITCNHEQPKHLGYEQRLLAELLAEIVATRISALESLEYSRTELQVQQLERAMVEGISQEGDWSAAIFGHSGKILQPMDATGAILISADHYLTVGAVPDRNLILPLVKWLDHHCSDSIFCSTSIGIDYPEFAPIADQSPGVIAAPVSGVGGEYVMWFREEHTRTVTWGGDPNKSVVNNFDTGRIQPRESFAQWKQLLKNTSSEWTKSERSAAKLIGASIADIMQQFRAMQVMIAHSQLDTLAQQISNSDLPALIADDKGEVLLCNDSFNALLWKDKPESTNVVELASMFQERSFASHNLRSLLSEQTPWRGAVTLNAKSVLIRADTVFASNQKVLGYIILLTDISDRQMAENARRRFPHAQTNDLHMHTQGLNSQATKMYETLLHAVMENAQLAALEITDGIDAQRIPLMLQGVESSMMRTSRLIGALVQHVNLQSKHKEQ